MDFWNAFASLFSNFGNLTWQMVVMWGIGALLIYLAIAKKMEPSLLLPMGFGAILINLPLSGAITQGDTVGPISALFEAGMSNELLPPVALHRHRCDDRLRPAARETVADALRRSGAVRHLLHPLPRGLLLRFEGRRFHRRHRRGRRPPRPSSWPTSCTPSTLVPSWWRPTATWRWSPSCSRRSSNC